MKVSIPIEHVKALMEKEFICEVHCNGIDLCRAPIDHRDDKIDRNGDIRGHDFLLLGFQKYAGGANEGDMATATIVDILSEIDDAKSRLRLQRKMLAGFINCKPV